MSQQCASCSHESPDGAKFCLECGTPFARSCPSCRQPVPGGAKFCMECGTPMAGGATAPAAPAAPSAGTLPGANGPVSERRTTTVLFGDLVAFTTLSEQRDPEEVRELLSAYFAVARTVVGRYGGTIEKFIGDAVMAVWGVPVSHEDDAERAVRAGIDLVAEVSALGASVGAPDLQMRVGITTGSVAVTLGAVNEGMVAGDAVNTAARVQTAAEPGTVWTDQETRGLTAAAVAYSDMGEHALKGKVEPVRLYRADTIVAAVGGAQRVDGLEAPLTGRDGEMRRIRELFHATQADARPRVVLVSGMPGVGKSRLGWEFEKYVDGLSDGVRWHRGRSLSYGDGVAFWAFAEMVRSRLGLLEDEDADAVRDRVRDGVATIAADDAEAGWIAPRVEALLGVWPGAPFERTDLFAAWTTLLDRVGGEGEGREPVVLLFEDMQFADSGLLDLLEHVLESTRASLFVLVLTRPELLDARPSLAAGRRATVLGLEPLGDTDLRSLVDGLVLDLPQRARDAIAERAEGVPLYAVETVRSLIDRDAVIAQEGRYVFVDHDHTLVDLDQLSAPTSLQTLIASRLDALTPLERRTVQDASVLGMAFRHAGLMALNEVGSYELDQSLNSLVRKGVIEVQGDPRSPELGQYRFLQALVREVAYGTLARKDRRTRHIAAADHLEGEGDAAAGLAGVIAQHLVDAYGATSDHDVTRAGLAARARDLLVTSAERSEALGSPEEALHATRTALDLDPEDAERTALQERAARVATAAGDNELAAELATAARAGYSAAGDRDGDFRSLRVLARSLQNLGRNNDALELVQAVLPHLGTPVTEDDRRLKATLLRVQTAVMRYGDRMAYLEATLDEVRLAEELGDPAMLAAALNGLAIGLIDAGSPTAYTALLHRCVEISREHRLLDNLSRSLANLLADLYLIDLERAGELAAEGIEVSRQVGDAYNREVTLINASFAWWLRGDWDLVTQHVLEWTDERPVSSATAGLTLAVARVCLARGLPLPEHGDLPDSDDPWEQFTKELLIALELAHGGAVAEAAAMADASVRRCYGGDGHTLDDFEVLWVPVVDLQLQAGEIDRAEALFDLAAPLLGGRTRPALRIEMARLRGAIQAARGEDPEVALREALAAGETYPAPYIVARTQLELGRWLLGQGRGAEGEPLLAQAREGFVRLGAAPAVVEVDEVTSSARVLVGGA